MRGSVPVPERQRRRSGALRRVRQHEAGPAAAGAVAGTGAAWFGLCLLTHLIYVRWFLLLFGSFGVAFGFGGKMCPCKTEPYFSVRSVDDI